ncbi:hypothetical protein [Streptomyces roseolilacinus]|uniref:hypothetical protein n=1 Tax=Streptomyces roseolilacinus TaxID=66904 RepID=UPI0038069020
MTLILTRNRVSTSPGAVHYPEAVELAGMLGKHKRQFLSSKAGQQLWWEILARTMGEWGAPLAWAVMTSAVRKPVQSWRDKHDPA